MRMFAASCLCILLVGIAHAGNHYVSHVAEEGWTTTITAYNDGPEDRTFDLYRYDSEGTETVTIGQIVPAYGELTLSNVDFGYGGTAHIETPEEDSPLKIKLAYRYGNSESLCEFFIPDGCLGQYWMLPNPFQSHFGWFGMALANFGRRDAEITLTAWKNGAVVDTTTATIPQFEKLVDIASGFWTGVQYADVDLVTIESDLPIPPPISITGNNEQDRHVFFLAQREVETDPPATHVYFVPHVAKDNWTTTLTVYNNKGSAALVTLRSWNPDGTVDVDGISHGVPGNGTVQLLAGTDFGYEGIARITTDNDVNIKLTYRFGESESLCEFFLQEVTSTQWFLPNSIHNWFDWFGLAICNPTAQPVVVAVDAYKDGEMLQIGTTLLEPHTKTVGLADEFWPSLSKTKATEYDDVDMVVIRSSAPIPGPLSITGNNEQDRHVFFLSGADQVDPDFPDPAFKAYVLDNFDTDHNGTIDGTEADAVYRIDTPGTWNNRGNIKDITGVEIFHNLEELVVEWEQLSWIPEVSGFPLLENLNANHNYLVMLPDWTSLTNLEWIICSYNNLTEIPPLASLTNLQRLDLKLNQLTSIPDMTGLNQMTRIELYDNHISELTGTGGMTEMTVFSIGRNNFDELPDISAMTQLNDLSCDENNISELPDLSPYTQLAYLVVFDNNIHSISGLSGLTNMYLMDLSKNPLTTLEDLSGLDNMVQFSIQYTNIGDVPGLGNMDSLRLFYCDYSNMSDLTPLTGKTDFSRLSCNGCVGITLPDFTGWTSLTRLYITFCQLDDVPDVTDCSSLQYFGAAWNNFGPDDCPMIQAIEAMGTVSFTYNPQHDGSTLTCD